MTMSLRCSQYTMGHNIWRHFVFNYNNSGISGIYIFCTSENKNEYSTYILLTGDAEALLAGQWTCDSQVVGLSPGWAPSCSGLSKLVTPVCLCNQAV